MDKCTHEERIQYWKDIILQCQKRQPGMSAKAWLKENGISEDTYYKWHRRIKMEAYEQLDQDEKLPVVQDNEITFAELKVSSKPDNSSIDPFTDDSLTPAAIIKTPYFSITITNDISNNLLNKILAEVKNV